MNEILKVIHTSYKVVTVAHLPPGHLLPWLACESDHLENLNTWNSTFSDSCPLNMFILGVLLQRNALVIMNT